VRGHYREQVTAVRRVVVLGALIALYMVIGSIPAQASSAPPLPTSMAAIGDSMTRATDVCCWYGDHPANSWATGGASWDGVTSQYERIRALKPAISGAAYNDSAAGAKMANAPAQASAAVQQRAKYVTILMGANDLCTSSTATMTSVDVFRAQYAQALATLEAGLPAKSHIFVASIPNVYHLWELYHNDPIATFVWSTAHICQSLLSSANTDAQRQAVRDREAAFNSILAQECGKYANCRFDGNAVFNYSFSGSQVSKLDYFHPSLSGQAALASVTWHASWWSTTA
jgi:lysophospholipase L1-like esterase